MGNTLHALIRFILHIYTEKSSHLFKKEEGQFGGLPNNFYLS